MSSKEAAYVHLLHARESNVKQIGHFRTTLSIFLPRGYSQKNWVGVCGPLPKTLTLFMTKTCEIPYPIYDLTLKSKRSSDQTVNITVKDFCRFPGDFLFDNDEK